MSGVSREYELARAFVSLADTLVADYDVVDLLQNLVDTSVQLLKSEAGGLLLADDYGVLTLVASTSEETSLVELLQLESGNAHQHPWFGIGIQGSPGSYRLLRKAGTASRTAARMRALTSPGSPTPDT